MLEHAIRITARSDAQAVFDRTAVSARRMGDSIGASAGTVGNRLRLTTNNANDLDKAIGRVGNKNSLGTTATDAGKLGVALDHAGDKSAALTGKLEGIRNAAGGLALAGGAGLTLANNLIRVAAEGDAVEKRLESILSQQKRMQDLGGINDAIGNIAEKGHFADDDELRDAAVKMASFSVETQHMGTLLENAARQARTMGTDVGSVAEQLAKAYSTGNAAGLKRSGVVITPDEIKAIKEAYGISQQMGQMKFMEIIGPAIVNNTVELANSLTDAQAAANDAARSLDDLQTAAGRGAGNAKKSVDQLGASVLKLVGANEDAAEAAGGILYVGSAAATAVGGVVSLGSQVGIMALSLQAAGVSGTAAMGAIATGAATAGAAIAAMAIPLALIATTAVAVFKGIQWTKDAMKLSDEEMEKRGGIQAWQADRAAMWGDRMAAGDIAKGNEAEAESARLFASMRKGPRLPAMPNNNTAGQSGLEATAQTLRNFTANPSAFSPVAPVESNVSNIIRIPNRQKPKPITVDTRNARYNAEGDQVITVIVKRLQDGFMGASA